MITRNVFGEIEPRIGEYFIRKNQSGKYEILKNELCYITEATLFNPVFIWENIEPFDSRVKAYAWLKQNVENLL